MTHAPAPWRWEVPTPKDSEGDIDQLIAADGTKVCDFGDCTQYYPCCGTPPEGANRALIAAAPELLASLVEVTRMLEAAHHSLGMWTDDNPRIVKARAAIAKATPSTSATDGAVSSSD